MNEWTPKMGKENFERRELQTIRHRCEYLAGTSGMDSRWVRAFLNLAVAADHLDGMMARCELPVTVGVTEDHGHATSNGGSNA